MKRHTKIIVLILTAAWIIFIFSNSMKPGEDSTADSLFFKNILDNILRFFGITPADNLMYIIRKGAHMTEYCVLAVIFGIFCINSFSEIPKFTYKMFYIMFLVLFVACCDEFIQLSSAGRSSEVKDVFIDFSGGMIGVMICALINRLKLRKG